jgi:ribulose-5-phosphate 4-epimerase/fuculose-1-phosphate aldolase
MTEDDVKKQLAEITTELFHAGVITATGGNISVRCATRFDAAWITPSQIFKRELTPDQMVMIGMDGKKIQGEFTPSVESVYHASILKHRKNINAVVHTHAPLSIVFGLCEMEWIPITAEAIFMSNIPMIPWYLAGSNELAAAVEKEVSRTESRGAFLRNHGLITIGETLREAADATLAVEHTIKILVTCKLLGKEPTDILADAMKFLIDYEGGA